MHPNAQLITRFYTAFQNRDAEAMAACYHPDVTFSDPVFLDLKGGRARNMWRMLCASARDLTIEVRDIQADDASGQAHWDATYTFSKTGRKVFNQIDARFWFKDGLICNHQDTFDLWAWSGMALGIPGKLFGWAPPLQNGIRKTATKGLDAFVQKRETR